MNCVERIVEYAELPTEAQVVPVVPVAAADGGAGSDGGGSAADAGAATAAAAAAAASDIDDALVREGRWLTAGAVSFEALTVQYRPGLPPALRGFTLAVAAGEKLGIVGRTGAGKSTLLLALLRLVPWRGGRVRVDGVDVRRVPLDALRGAIAVIPQDPVIFVGRCVPVLCPCSLHAARCGGGGGCCCC
jgi:ABC-type multidrug transport system fused ATPase/permease subunit